jgi:hypothetical protein
MKKALKIFGIFIIALLVLIISLSVIAKIKEKEIADIVLRKIGKSINATIVIDDISLNLIRRFPLATIELKSIWFGPPAASGLSDSLISKEEPLATINRFFVSVKTRPLFKGEFDIMKVDIKGVDLIYMVDKNGTSNFDFLIDTTRTETADTTSISLNVLLKELTLKDIHCSYSDSSNLLSAQIVIPKAEVNGEIKDEYLHGSVKGVLYLSDCNYEATNLNLMKETKLDFDVTYSGDSVDVKELNISTDGADFNIIGSAVIRDTLETDFQIQDSKINIDELIKYVPIKTLEDIGLKKVKGMVNMNGSIRGFIADSLLPEVKMEFTMKKGSIVMTGYPPVKNISLAGSATNGKMRNNKTTSVSIKEFHAETGRSSIDISGKLNNLDRIQYNFNSDLVIDLGEFKELIPDSIMQDARGQILARLITKGVVPDSVGNDFVDYVLDRSRLDVTLNNLYLRLDSSLFLDSLSGELTYDLHHVTVSDLHVNVPLYKVNINNTSFDARLSGKVSEPSNLGIGLNSFQVRTGSSAFYGSATIRNLEAPEFNITGNIRLNLGEIKDLLPDTLVNNLSGEITAQFDSHGKLNPDSISDQINDLVFNNSAFQVNFDNVSVDMPDTLMNVNKLSGILQMKDDTLKINNTSGIYRGIDFSMDSTKIVNLYHSLIKEQGLQLYVEGRFKLGDLDYAMFAPFVAAYMDTTTTSSEDQNASVTAVNADSTASAFTYKVKGKLWIRSLTYKKARIKNISGLFNLSDSLYLVDQLKFTGFGGAHNTSVRYEIRKGEEQMLWIKNSIENMNVTQLLEDFDNFQEFYEPAITYENLSGILSSKVDAQVYFKNDSMIRNKMYVRGDIKLEKGGIYHYQLVKDMEPYLPGIDNLDVLEFKTINSNVFVFQDAVYVPTTLVVSNKLDATALGMQSFGEDYSYHFIVFLSEIIYGKSNRISKKQNKMGEEVTSTGRKKSGTLVKSYSINGKSRSGLDNKKDQEKMRSMVKASEGLLNVRFHPYNVSYNTGVQ